MGLNGYYYGNDPKLLRRWQDKIQPEYDRLEGEDLEEQDAVARLGRASSPDEQCFSYRSIRD